MTTPEQALEQARAAAIEMRAQGAYALAAEPAGLDPPEALTPGKLLEWAVIDPDLRNVRSTRRLGAPITALKRGLLWLLRQYHAELIAEQARFNVNVALYVGRLADRVAELEAELERRPKPPAP